MGFGIAHGQADGGLGERLIRDITRDDILRLMEIKMGRILKFNADKNEKLIAQLKKDLAQVEQHLANMVGHTVAWFSLAPRRPGR